MKWAWEFALEWVKEWGLAQGRAWLSVLWSARGWEPSDPEGGGECVDLGVGLEVGTSAANSTVSCNIPFSSSGKVEEIERAFLALGCWVT